MGATLLIFLFTLLLSPAAAEKLEIDRESDGIHIIQKRTPKKAAPSPEDAATEADAGADAGPDAGADAGADAGPDAGQEEQPPPSSRKQPESSKQDAKPREQVPLDENPDYIRDLNKLTDAYNRRVDNLQKERNRLSNRYNQRAGELRQQALQTEQAMALAEQNYERDRFEQLQQRRLDLLRRLQTLETNWQQTQTELRQRELNLQQDYDQAKQELRTRYQKKKAE